MGKKKTKKDRYFTIGETKSGTKVEVRKKDLKEAKKHEKKLIKKAEELDRIITDVMREYVPEGHVLETRVVPEEQSYFCLDESDDLNSRDLTREDVFEMMTDRELEAYDFLDNLTLSGDDAGASGSAFEEKLDDYDRETILRAVSELESSIARFVYVVNAGRYDLMAEEANYHLEAALEWMCLMAKKYQYMERYEELSEKVVKCNNAIDEAIFEMEGIENSLDGIMDEIEDYVVEYGIASEEDFESGPDTDDSFFSDLIDSHLD